MTRVHRTAFAAAVLLAAWHPGAARAETPEAAAEPPESGIALGELLRVSAMVELDYEAWRQRSDGVPRDSGSDDASITTQVAFELVPHPDWLIEAVFEHDDERRATRLDEGAITLARGAWRFRAGRLYLPFGEYLGRFVTGPAIEFGETRRTALLLGVTPGEAVDLALFAYDGRARPLAGTDRDWGLAVTASAGDDTTFGLSYLADLADSDHDLLAEAQRRYARRVAGLAGYLETTPGPFVASAEWVMALDAFRELDRDRDRPAAWNVEVAYPGDGGWSWAVRLEGSRELAEAPRWRAGVAVSRQLTARVRFGVEYLYAVFEDGLAEHDAGAPLDREHRVATRLSIRF